MKTPKTIKFSLPLQKPDKDGRYPVVRVNSLEELRDNFDPHGLLYALKTNNLLSRWLEVRGYADEKAQIEEMLSKNLHDNDLVKRMAKIFRLDVPDDELDDLLRDIALMERRREVVQQQTAQENDIISTSNLRYQQYLDLVKKITDNATDLVVIKNSLQEMKSRFPELVELGHPFLLDVLLDQSPLAVLAMLADADLRPYYLDYDFSGKPYDKEVRPYSSALAEKFPSSVIENKLRSNFKLRIGEKFSPGDSSIDYDDGYSRSLCEKLGFSVHIACVEYSSWQVFVTEDIKIICLGAYRKFGYSNKSCYFHSANADTSDYISSDNWNQCFTILNGLKAKQTDFLPSTDWYVYYVLLDDSAGVSQEQNIMTRRRTRRRTR